MNDQIQEVSEPREKNAVDAVMGEARGLADAGQFDAAIELLTTENRRNRSREIDRMLLSLRSDAFLAYNCETEPAEWPSDVPDQFGGKGIPEITLDKLNASSVRSGIENHGSLIVRDLLSPGQVDLMRNDIEQAFEAYNAIESDSVNQEMEGWYEPFSRDPERDRATKHSKGAMLTVDSPPALFDLLEIFESCGVRAAAQEFFGEPPMLLSRKGTLRSVAHNVKTGGWHQDGAFLGAEIRSLNIWIALTDCGVDAPGMDIVGKRVPHIVKTGTKFAEWATNPQAAREVGEGYIERPVFTAGDAIFFDHLCLHRTAADPGMTNRRYAIETWLMAPSTYRKTGLPILF